MNDTDFKFSSKVILIPFLFVLLLWIVFWVEVRFKINLTQYGIYPRDLVGLRGVIFSPFLHGNLEHLYNNSIPLFILTMSLYYFYDNVATKILFYGVLVSGILTWTIGRSNIHIGASSLIYVLVAFIFFKGILTKYFRLVALSLSVIMIYGGMIWYVFPDMDAEKNISWEGHLSGLITGIVFALFFKTPQFEKVIKYEWEHPDFDAENDPFMQRFDENGNFVPTPKPEVIPEDHQNAGNISTTQQDINFVYIYHKSEVEK